VIFGSSGIYIYIYLHLKRHFKRIKVLGNHSYGESSQTGDEFVETTTSSSIRKGSFGFRKGSAGFRELSDFSGSRKASADPSLSTWAPGSPMSTRRPTEATIDWDARPAPKTAIVFQEPKMDLEGGGIDHNKRLPNIPLSAQRLRPLSTFERNRQATETRIKKAFLLNAYPIMYIILWIPGIMNRLAEASGHPTRVLVILQSSTQFVGLANAITYGLNEKIWPKLREKFTGRKT
jgi:hypothetical protein